MKKITKLKYFDRAIGAALLFGLFALGTNAIAVIFDPARSIPAGNFFCVLSALALGPVAGVISGTFSLIPRAFVTGEYFDSLRFLAFLAALGYSAKAWKQVPAFIILAGLWVVMAPVSFFLLGQHAHVIAVMAAAEVMITLFASTLLLHRGFWGSVTARPRHTEFRDICTYGAASILTVGYTIGCILFWSWHPTSFAEHAIAFTFLGFILISITVVVLQGLAQKLQDNITHYIPRALAQNTFSGLSSTNWRRSALGNGSSEGEFPDAKTLAKKWNTVTNAKADATASEGILAIRGDNTVSFVNRAFRSFLKDHDPNLLGKQLNDVQLPEEIRSVLNELVSVARAGGHKTTEVKLNRLPDKLRFLQLAAIPGEESPHASLNCGPESVVINIKDISDRRTVEDHLLQGQRLASLGSTVKGLAHSLNNYLTSVSGHVSFARNAENSEVRNAALAEALDASQQAGTLIRKLLEFAEDRPGGLRSVNLTELMDSQLDMISRVLGTDVDLSVNVSDDPVGAHCDPQMLTQAITNVVINAKEALEADGKREIEISLQPEEVHESVARMIPGGRPGHFARLTVKDSGRGMKSEILARAFDPLFTTKQDHGHTGLGLSMVYAIIRAHDGFLSVQTNPGKGTTVSLYIPIQDWKDESIGSKLALIGDKAANVTAESVLVVEDDPAVRDVVTQMLRTLGYTVQSCSNGPEALEVCAEKTFDLALVDMMMPHMSGTELIERIQSMSDKTRTLMMTGYGASPEDLQALHTLVIPKPFDIDTLSDFIAQTMTEIEAVHVNQVEEEVV